MQNLKVIPADSVKNSRTVIDDNFSTLASNNSGTSFPTSNLYVGMLCYRSDLKAIYQLIATTPTWKMLIDLSGDTASIPGNAATATTLQTARTIGLSGVTATAQSFDGSGAITISVTAVPATLLTGTVGLVIAATASKPASVAGNGIWIETLS